MNVPENPMLGRRCFESRTTSNIATALLSEEQVVEQPPVLKHK